MSFLSFGFLSGDRPCRVSTSRNGVSYIRRELFAEFVRCSFDEHSSGSVCFVARKPPPSPPPAAAAAAPSPPSASVTMRSDEAKRYYVNIM